MVYYLSMDKNNPYLIFSFSNTIKDIPEEEWNALFGEDLIEGYGYQKTTEESGLEGFSFGYRLGKRNNKILAIIPFFIMDFSFAILMRGLLKKLVIFLQGKFKDFLKMRLIFLGNPLTEEFYFGLAEKEDLCRTFEGALASLK